MDPGIYSWMVHSQQSIDGVRHARRACELKGIPVVRCFTEFVACDEGAADRVVVASVQPHAPTVESVGEHGPLPQVSVLVIRQLHHVRRRAA